MDMTFSATPMVAEGAVVAAVIRVVTNLVHKAISLIERVAPKSCPSIAGSSLSAVAPDNNFRGGTALAAA